MAARQLVFREDGRKALKCGVGKQDEIQGRIKQINKTWATT